MQETEVNPYFEGLVQGIRISRLNTTTHINQMVICPACENIFWNPRMCSQPKCGHTLCEPCLNKSLQDKEICRGCEKPAKYLINGYLQDQILSKLIFRCKYSPKCPKLINYEDLPYHFCPFEQITCTMDCEWKGERGDLSTHEKSCPEVIICCRNTECHEKFKRGSSNEHMLTCPHEIVECQWECGFSDARHKLEEHLSEECTAFHIECKYANRGCTLKPMRSKYQTHIDSCIFQPKDLECGHKVNLGEIQVHIKNCSQYPLSCFDCGFKFPRHEINLTKHKCIPFLSQKLIKTQEKYIKNKMKEMNRSFEKKIMELTGEIENLKNTQKALKCQHCKKVKVAKAFVDCYNCYNIICIFCATKCINCRKYFCKECVLICPICPNKACPCLTKRSICELCKSSLVYLKCCEFTCKICNRDICEACDPFMWSIRTPICSDCISKQTTQLLLVPVAATSTYTDDYGDSQLSNTLVPNQDAWCSKYYEESRSSAKDEIIYKIKDGNCFVTRIELRTAGGLQFNKMEVFIGISEGIYTLLNTTPQCLENISIPFDKYNVTHFIKLVFTGANEGQFCIYEVKLFGINSIHLG